MSNYLIISFLHLRGHYLFSMRTQDKEGKVRQVKSVMRRFHPLCISVKGQVGNEISKHDYRFNFVKVD